MAPFDVIKEEFLRQIQKQQFDEIATHEIKVADVSESLDLMRSSEKSKTLCKPLEGKLKELIAQRQEFQSACDTLIRKVTNSEEVKHLEICGGIFRRECKKLAAALPMYAQRSDILKTIRDTQVCIILGETGSGKSTQVPLYLLEDETGQQKPIVCTQPRKVAALSLAKYVSSEMGCALGSTVGYHVGRESEADKSTELLYMTDHRLLNECLRDPDLSQYSCVIVDEAHERSIYTDLLLGMIKKCLVKRSDLKVIITSATIDPDIFVKYFGGCPVLRVPGRLYPVDVIYKQQPRGPQDDYLSEAIEKARSVHLTEEPGDILVFLATPAETELACNTLGNTCESIVCLQLHGKLQPEEQQKVFEDAPRGQRKVIFSTNVAETSVTIPGVKYVIDTGMCKEKTYDARRNMGVLEIRNISRSSADQRKGRAGRTVAGKCFRLFLEMEFEGFVKTAAPEILRVHLGQALLTLMELGVEDPLSFDFVEAPTTAAMVGAMKALCEIGAVTETTGKLTKLGSNLSRLTLEPRLAKFVLEGARTDFPLESIVTAAYVCSGSNAYYRAGSKEEKAKADELKTNFCHEDGDFLTFLNVYREWQKGENEKERREWCFANNINAKTMKTVYQQVNDIRYEMRRHLGIEVGMQFRENTATLNEVLARLLLICYPSQLCHFSGHQQAGYFLSTGEACYHVHPSSALRFLGQTPKWVVYNQLLKTSQDFMLNLAVVSDDMVQQKKKDGLLKIDEAYLQDIMVSGKEVPKIGTHLLRSLAGPRHTVRRRLEEMISRELGGKPVVIDLDFHKVTAMVYTSAGCHPVAERAIQEFLMNERTKLMKEKVQEAVGPDNPICTIIGSGGSVEQLLMPGDFRVFYLNTPQDTFSETLQQMFESFGEVVISDFKRTKAQDRDQGRLAYSSAMNAEKAFQYACELEDCKAWPEKTADRTRVSSAFRLKLSWIRRPNKGCAFIKCGNDETARRVFDILTRSRGLTVLGHLPSLKFRAQGDIRIDNIDAKLSNTVITERIKHLVSSGYNGDPPEVRVPREPGFLTTSQDIEHYKEKLCTLITDIGKTSDFYIVMREPRNTATVEQIAWVYFKDVNAGARVLTELEYTEPHLRYISKRLVGSVVVSGRVKTVLQSSLSQCQAAFNTVDKEMTMKSAERGNWIISISAKSVELYAEMKKAVDQIICPEIIDCFDENCVQAQLLHPESEDFLQDVERATETCIYVDKRCKRINITGTTENKENAKTRIGEHLKTLKQRFTERIKLTGAGFPRSMLRTFLQRYGIQLDDLITRCHLQSARLDIPRQTLVAVGDNDAVANVRGLVEEMKRQLQEDGENDFSEDEGPDCSVCFCPADNLYRLNSCGHPYCFTCLTSLVSSAIKNSEFPLICSQEQCPDPLLLRDIREVIGASFENLAKSSVACYVKQQSDKAKYCTTPDCDSVYRVTTESSSFTCPVCFIQICTACGLGFHEGLTCEQNKYENTDEKENVQRWLNEDKSSRALCPGCKTRIEKIGGCNRMICSRCNAIFCWVCKQTFSSETACYDHLGRSCGGIFPNQVY